MKYEGRSFLQRGKTKHKKAAGKVVECFGGVTPLTAYPGMTEIFMAFGVLPLGVTTPPGGLTSPRSNKDRNPDRLPDKAMPP